MGRLGARKAGRFEAPTGVRPSVNQNSPNAGDREDR